MKVVVLGAGIIGVYSAYFLAKAGHDVTVVERREGAGLETSFANGGQLSAGHAEPWANPSAPLSLLKWLGRKDAPLVFHLRADPALWRFSLRFLANCRAAKTAENIRRILRLALLSREVQAETEAETEIDFDLRRQGILHFYRESKALAHARRQAEVISGLGCRCDSLDADACISLEPALAASKESLAGGIFCPDDASGDTFKFTRGLADYCAGIGVDFRYGVTVNAILGDGGAFTGVETSAGPIAADAGIVALASFSRALVRPLGIRLAIYPAKGYSVTLPVNDDNAPRISLTDDAHKLVYSRLGADLRIAGTAEFSGYDMGLDEGRTGAILATVMDEFPGCGDAGKAEFWTGLRPLTADGAPIIGKTRLGGLFLNTGHGTLGWTLAAGSGLVVADLVTGETPRIDVGELGSDRFH